MIKLVVSDVDGTLVKDGTLKINLSKGRERNESLKENR